MQAKPRLQRLFGPSGRCLNVALDHGIFGEGSFLPGLVQFETALHAVAQAGPNALQLSPGQAPLLYRQAIHPKPALVLRLDSTNAYGSTPGALFAELVEEGLEAALRLDAAAVVLNLLWIEGEARLLRDCLRNIARVKPLAERYGLPLMLEPLVLRPGGYEVEGAPERIVPLVRQAVELGADLIKADFTQPLEAFHQVVEAAAGRPVLARGGGRVPEELLLERTQAVLAQGARGVVYGRNILQHPNPKGLIQTLMQMLHPA